ncbi:hypothetical protein TVAG_205270 [Trichomonas vaginalis G3]|uniref:Surface antigen BspA-like n=1 Tax=Trichomonas vaginalis (strain ATCC PRA-98 / G3) TaxID=412133 RepID=A2FFQ7_TRIV3|nr:ribonuclease inhibitor domain-containing protein [Trichomonas vaginalis G3]EAX96241.1 hypothetical protein TVAG_205270 [Trichomonas vaginalis G3]KAI5516251.1 ribonuclease inhibitor domain-containing protein [Trichomonas vaginalis G3]|eukprot:XP_001309171.1 hypothetical protein [Trichomonas vaginalis G3]
MSLTLEDIGSSVSEYTIPRDVVSIANGTSNQYFALKSIQTLRKISFESPSSLKYLGHYSFYCCSHLSEADLSNCSFLENIGSFCFAECYSLSRVIFPKQSKLEILGIAAFSGADLVLSYSFPSSLMYIKGNILDTGCFSNYAGNELRFNEGLVSIGPCACIYANCKYIYLPSSLTTLHPYAFICIPNLIEIFGSGSISYSIVEKALLSHDETILYTFPAQINGIYCVPNTVKILSFDCFCYSRLQQIIIPESCIEFKRTPFFHMKSLTYLKIPKSIIKLPSLVINDCPNLRNLTIELENIPSLNYQSVEIITLGNETKVIQDYAFASAVNLKSIIIPPSVTMIGVGAFQGLKKLQWVRIYGQPTIGNSAFLNTRISCGVDCYSSLIDPLIASGINSNSFNYCCITHAIQNKACFRNLFDIYAFIFLLV